MIGCVCEGEGTHHITLSINIKGGGQNVVSVQQAVLFERLMETHELP